MLSVHGNPYRYKDHQMIQSGDMQTIQQQHDFASNLLFTNITAQHNGLYTCVAMNDAAATNYTARLVVKGNLFSYFLLFLLLFLVTFKLVVILLAPPPS